MSSRSHLRQYLPSPSSWRLVETEILRNVEGGVRDWNYWKNDNF